jgi:hypothetical protein
MKKIYSLVLIFLCITQSFSLAYGWNDGYEAYPFANNYDDYTTRIHYGTMDWIADGVISLLKGYNSKWQFLANMDAIYFVGTEAIKNPNINMILNNETVKGIGDFNSLYIRWNGTVLSRENIFSKISNASEKALHALQEEKYELATYYFGIITSYIASVFYYPIHELNTISYWNERSFLDSRITPYTSDHSNPNWFFLWHPHNPLNTTSNAIKNHAYNVMWNNTINVLWLKENITSVIIVKDYHTLIQNYDIHSPTRMFYTHYEYLLNTCIHYIIDVLHTIFLESEAIGGDIKISSPFSRLEKKWQYGIIAICIGIFGILVYPIYAKASGKKISLAFWRKRKVIQSK